MAFSHRLGVVLVLLTLGGTEVVLGFGGHPPTSWLAVHRTPTRSVSQDGWVRASRRTSIQAMDFSFAEDFKPEEKVAEKKKEDPTAAFIVGAVVRIAKSVKAYQVSPKGFGSYDDDKNFVPLQKSATDRASKNLQVPVGFRGVVTKVYNSGDLSANFPVQVKFEPGKHTEEGYDPPVLFLFHLSQRELELVE